MWLLLISVALINAVIIHSDISEVVESISLFTALKRNGELNK
jgi:hypothetical protein